MNPVYWAVGLLVATSLIYTGTAVAYLFSSRPGMMLCFLGYVMANIGLIWDAIHQAAK